MVLCGVQYKFITTQHGFVFSARRHLPHMVTTSYTNEIKLYGVLPPSLPPPLHPSLNPSLLLASLALTYLALLCESCMYAYFRVRGVYSSFVNWWSRPLCLQDAFVSS